MHEHSKRVSPLVVLMMLAAFAITIVAAVWIVRKLDSMSRASWSNARPEVRNAADSNGATSVVRARLPGVVARITPIVGGDQRGSIGSAVVERRLPTMAFALQPGESLDSRLPPGPFKAEFDVPFYTAMSREAQLGVEFQGGKVIVRRRGQIILSDAACEEPRLALTSQPVNLLVEQDSMQIQFESNGRQPCRLRAMWKPVDAMVPLPLPAEPTALLSDEALKGFALVQQFHCVACHASGDNELHAILSVNTPPLLGDVGGRIRAEWLSGWLSDPQSIKPGSLMPKLSIEPDVVEDIAQYLVSMGGPMDAPPTTPNQDLANTGMVLYHTVGCFACHGAMEKVDALPGGHPASRLEPLETYHSLGRPSQKYTTKSLTEFLLEPLKHWPSGRMPSMSLERMEAEAIAEYLIAHDQASHPPPVAATSFALDAARAERGRASFSAAGCANCHSLGPDRPLAPITLSGPSLESLAKSGSAPLGGCMANPAAAGAPQFDLSSSQRRAIEAFLRSLPGRRTDSVPLDHMALTIARLNCTNCHEYQGDRGPETFIAQYFSAIEEADLGDEGRLPPNLSEVGSKLNPQWFHDVLAAGGRARTYLGARMPQFGEANIDALPKQFAAASGAWPQPDQGPALPSDYGEIGRQLVGANAMNCIQCHNVGGRPSTGTPGPDLAQMAERLRYDAFSRWIHDPKLTRPGTRMPSFFVNGVSGFTDMLEGDADKQVDAMWAYLSLGEFMPVPDGLVDPASLTLQVKDEPVIFRSFIKGAGVRAIAVGYPEQIHIAFDAAKCKLAEAWEGDFINAAGAWANRGGTETNPKSVKWSAPKDGLFVSASVGGGSTTEITPKFRGYRLDEQRRPIFIYELHAGEIEVLVHEQPLPARREGKPSLTQRFSLEGPKGTQIILMPGKRIANGLSGDVANGAASITLDDTGKAEFELEVTW